MELLSEDNLKLMKNSKYDYKSYGIHLAPHKLAGKHNVCPDASEGCIKACLNTSGMGNLNRTQISRINKTKFFFAHKDEFMKQLHREISNKIKNNKKGYKLSFRLNLTSDIPWENVKYQGKSIMEHFPKIQFMDYTKSVSRMLRSITDVNFPKNYHLTFSKSEKNTSACEIILACGGNIAVVFDKKLPKTYLGKKVIDGVKHDLRFKDPKNVVVGLVALGKAKNDKSGFVVKDGY